MKKYFCTVCKKNDIEEDYIISVYIPKVKKKIIKKNEMLCYDCFEKRIRRTPNSKVSF
jgi:hypothetical protein